MPRGWYAYIGSPADKTAAGSYEHVGTPFECVSFGTICVIYAYFTGSGAPPLNPDSPLTTGVLSYITESNVFSTDRPGGANKKYLYVKAS